MRHAATTMRTRNATSPTGLDLPGVGRQRIEGNPLKEDEIAMFEMFERENWSAERRRSYILSTCKPKAST